ncbi:MAG: DUF58 domain-containing protein [Candidatus Micrarchaeia archaeon]|jgi:uncharacterized protein (DUF58 family)
MMRLDIDPKPRVEYLELVTHRLVTSNFMGDYQSVFKGRGVIFESYREYSNSDDASEIDWKATMRCGKTMVKEYVEERNLEVFFLIDASYTMVFGSQKKLKHEYAAEMAASMAFAILDRGDAVGLGMFSDRLHGFLAPERGHVQYRRILRELSQPANYDGPCDFEAAVRTCIHRLKPQTLLVLITDGVNMDGDWRVPLKVANRKFEVVILLVRDPRDDELPQGTGQVAVENPSTGEQMLLDTDSIRERYAQASRGILEQNMALFRDSGIVDVPVMHTNEDFPKHVVSFFERRKRRLR